MFEHFKKSLVLLFKSYDTKENHNKLIYWLGWLVYVGTKLIVLGQVVWILVRWQDIGSGIEVYPDFGISQEITMLLATFFGLMFMSGAAMRMATIYAYLDPKVTQRKAWFLLQSIAVVVGVFGTVIMNTDVILGAPLMVGSLLAGKIVDKFYKNDSK